ncbi:hypothetical protein EG832_02605 [bacterium]|nr:hypothetical protein [bacterium]
MYEQTSALQNVDTELQSKLSIFIAAREKIAQFASKCRDCIINSPETHAAALKIAKDAASIETLIATKRKELTKPLDDQKKMIMNLEKDLVAELDESKTDLRKRILAFEQEQQKIIQEQIRQQLEERRKLEEEKRAMERKLEEQAVSFADMDDGLLEEFEAMKEKEVALAEAIAAPEIKSNITKTWEWELTEIGLVPRQYLMADRDKIKAAIKSGERNIPGIRIYQEEGLRLR